MTCAQDSLYYYILYKLKAVILYNVISTAAVIQTKGKGQ